MLNGLIRVNNTPGTPGRITFNNVPTGNHALIAYTVHAPLHVQNGDYWVIGETSSTNYIRPMNVDEYNAAPGFYRGSSSNPNVRPLASYVRFDNVQPLGGAGGSIELGWDTARLAAGSSVPVNAVQLVLNAPNPGRARVVTADPQPTVVWPEAQPGSRLKLQAEPDLSMAQEWRTLPAGGNVSGVNAATLTWQHALNDEANYSVAVFNPAGSAISRVRRSVCPPSTSTHLRWLLEIR
jgi:hypothetical protein